MWAGNSRCYRAELFIFSGRYTYAREDDGRLEVGPFEAHHGLSLPQIILDDSERSYRGGH
jgi:hypothetical protein